MHINIWSDVRCPFCYIGKHKFEKALNQFEHKDKIKVTWHSFELDPTLKTNTEISELEHLAKVKGMSKPQVEQMIKGVQQMGKEMGLTLNFEKMKLANSFTAHRLIQLAKSKGFDNEVEEALFKAHFEEGKNIDDKKVLLEIGKNIGLREEDVNRMLFTDEFEKEVNQDKQEAARKGINGVPFFVFDERYGISGAQPEEAFLKMLEKSWSHYEENSSNLIVEKGSSCDVDGHCD